MLQVPEGRLLLQTLRSHDQYNTTIYGLDDRYRGIQGAGGWSSCTPTTSSTSASSDGEIVDLVSEWTDGSERIAPEFRVVAYDTPRGCAAAYYPETNPLVPLDSTAIGSNCPDLQVGDRPAGDPTGERGGRRQLGGCGRGFRRRSQVRRGAVPPQLSGCDRVVGAMSDPQTDLQTLAARTVMASFDGGTLPEWARRRLAGGMGGICLFGENVTSIEAIGRLCAAIHEAAPDAIVSLDEEGGDVTRLYYQVGSPHAGHAALGAVDYPTLTRAVAQDIGSELRAVGVDLDLAPVADVNSNSLNPVIGVGSFGAEPELVARHVAAFVDGLQTAGVGACLKHFPGHGDTVADSHVALPVAEAPVEVFGGGGWCPSERGSPPRRWR